MLTAASTIVSAEEEHVGIFFGLPSNGKLEFVVGDATLELSKHEIHALFEKLFQLSADESNRAAIKSS